MKVLQVISYGYLAGGAEKSVLLLKQELSRRGHQVMIISSDHKNRSEPHFSDKEFPEIDNATASLVAKATRHLWYPASYRTIKEMVAAFAPDVAHFHVMGQLSPSALSALGTTPGVLTVHGPEEYVSGILEWGFPKHLFRDDHVAVSNLTALGRGYDLYFRHVQRPLYAHGFRKHLRALIAPSKYMAQVLEKENFGVPIHHLYNGISLPKLQPLQNRQRLLYVGRLEYVKGVGVLLEALRRISTQFPHIHVSIVGDGSARLELEAFVRQRHLEKHVTFHGWLAPAAVHNEYVKSTAVIIPSIWPENLPTVCIEALATGRPVIGTNSGGIPELIQDGVTGRIVPKGDAGALAAAIIELLSWSDFSATAQACAHSMQDFQITTFVQNLEQLYRQILDKTEGSA